MLGLQAQSAFAIERALTNVLLKHFQRQNFLAWNSGLLDVNDSRLDAFNNFHFFAASFSYVDPLRRWDAQRKKFVPTPALFHVCSGVCGLEDIEGFCARIERAGLNPNTNLKIVGIVAAREFTGDAFKAAKSAGFIIINLDEFFGETAFEAIAAVQDLLKNVGGDPEKANAEEYDALSKSLDSLKTNPFIVELKGLAFEALAGFLIRNEGWEEVQLNLKVPWETMTREVDVSGQKCAWDEISIAECKAEAAGKKLDPGFVTKFFTETVPAFVKAKCPNQNPSHCFAEIWTTGEVGNAAWEELNSVKLKKFIRPKLLGHDDLLKRIPKTLVGTKRLIQTIAEA